MTQRSVREKEAEEQVIQIPNTCSLFFNHSKSKNVSSIFCLHTNSYMLHFLHEGNVTESTLLSYFTHFFEYEFDRKDHIRGDNIDQFCHEWVILVFCFSDGSK